MIAIEEKNDVGAITEHVQIMPGQPLETGNELTYLVGTHEPGGADANLVRQFVLLLETPLEDCFERWCL